MQAEILLKKPKKTFNFYDLVSDRMPETWVSGFWKCRRGENEF